MRQSKKKVSISKLDIVMLLIIILYFVLWYTLKPSEVAVEEVRVPQIQIVYILVEPETAQSDKVDEPEIVKVITPTRSDTRDFVITAYDNSVASQGKWVDQTATGFNLKGHTLESAKCIAVDPKIIPLHSKVELTFDEPYKHLDGVYIARDTGGAIKGKRIDLFMGDGDVRQQALSFGKRNVQVRIIE